MKMKIILKSITSNVEFLCLSSVNAIVSLKTHTFNLNKFYPHYHIFQSYANVLFALEPSSTYNENLKTSYDDSYIMAVNHF